MNTNNIWKQDFYVLRNKDARIPTCKNLKLDKMMKSGTKNGQDNIVLS